MVQPPSGDKLARLEETLRTKRLSGTDETVQAVVGVLLHQESGSELSVLLIHRADRTDDPWSGQIGFPGGRVGRSDTSAREALKREVIEEVGINLDEYGQELGTLSVGSPMKQLDMKVQPWVYGLNTMPKIKIGPEVQNAFWVPVSRLPSLRASAEIEIRGTRRIVEAFHINGYVVWGYTHRVLNELLSIPEAVN